MRNHSTALLKEVSAAALARSSCQRAVLRYNSSSSSSSPSTSSNSAYTPPSSSSHASTSSSASSQGKTTHFGFREVPEEQKETLGE